jgi:hypothetical protein
VWVAAIKESDAFKNDGMIIITFDEADLSTDLSDPQRTLKANEAASVPCCNEQPGPSADKPGLFGLGGGRVGAIILSPLVAPGENATPFNHYSLLRSIEDLFQLDHLGFARPDGLKTFQECGVFK